MGADRRAENGPRGLKFVGTASISEQFIRSNVRVKAGDVYHPDNTQDDIKALYATGEFYNIRVTADQADDGGVIVTFIVQARPLHFGDQHRRQ